MYYIDYCGKAAALYALTAKVSDSLSEIPVLFCVCRLRHYFHRGILGHVPLPFPVKARLIVSPH